MDIDRQPSALPTNSWDLTRKPKDEIVEEIHELRQAYAAQFDFDLDKIFEDLKRKEALNPAPRVQTPPLEPNPPRLA